MTATAEICRDEALAEIDALPAEYLPFLLQMMRAFRECNLEISCGKLPAGQV